MSENPKNVSFEVLCFFWFAKFCSYLYIRKKPPDFYGVWDNFDYFHPLCFSRKESIHWPKNHHIQFRPSLHVFCRKIRVAFFFCCQPRSKLKSVEFPETLVEKRSNNKFIEFTNPHSVWKSQKKVAFHIASEAEKSSLKIPKLVNFGEFLKT